jgi:hypothetical protein
LPPPLHERQRHLAMIRRSLAPGKTVVWLRRANVRCYARPDGLASGIGKATAAALARLGTQVVLAARDDATARRLWQLSEEMTGLTPARPAGT